MRRYLKAIHRNCIIRMKIAILIIVAGLIFSCGSNKKKQDAAIISTEDYKKLDTVLYFSGYWLSEDYFNSIQEFHSPRRAQDGSQFIVIPNNTLQQTIMIYNFHEGGSFLKLLKNEENYEVWEVQDDSLTQMLYLVEFVSPEKIKLGDKTFVKISHQTDQDNHQILEEILFKGEYVNSEGKSIEFKPNGRLVGLENFTYYQPAIDYFDAGMQVDQIGLGNSQKDLEWYGFKFNSDTLEIYRLNCLTFDSTMNSCVEVNFGQLKYKFRRKG